MAAGEKRRFRERKGDLGREKTFKGKEKQ